MASRNKRVMKEIQDCQRESASTQINIQMVGDDLSNLRGQFPGPPNSPYEGGTFEVAIEVPPRYPFEPLKMKFITKVYHPNVSSQSGAICLDILKDAWSPVLTLKTTLVSLQSLLCSPEPNDPQDAEVAKVYLSDRSVYERTARYWTEMYASGGTKKPSGSTASEHRPSMSTPSQSTAAVAAAVATGGGGGGATSKSTSTGQQQGSTRLKSSAPSEIGSRSLSNEAEEQIVTFGLDRPTVNRFQAMGFAPDLVIKTLIELKFQPPYLNNFTLQIPDDELLEALLLAQ